MYRATLLLPDATVANIAESLGWPEPRVRAALDELADLELLRSSLAGDKRVRLKDPKVALEVLLARRQAQVARQQQEVESGRAAINQLIADYRDPTGRPNSGMERITDLNEVRDLLDSLGARARTETLAFAPGGRQTQENRQASRPVAEGLLARGVQMKTIYQSSVRNDPGSLEHAKWLSERGAEVRTAPGLPMRMQIIDREVAVVPVAPEDSSLGAVVVREPGALAGLCALFDHVWHQAEPFGSVTHTKSQITTVQRELLQLLAAGLTDEAAARRLGVSLRTERRMITELMEQLGANSRFQLGRRAEEQGLL